MSERYIPEHRRTQFKAKGAFASDVVRRRREEQQVEIRKAKREENLAKRRGINTGPDRPGASLGAEPDSDDDTAPTESQVRVTIFCHDTSSSCLLFVALWWLPVLWGASGARLITRFARSPPLRVAFATLRPSPCTCVFLRVSTQRAASPLFPND